jgi:putative transcriptional regulator
VILVRDPGKADRVSVGRTIASAVLALGHAGWVPGQLENEIQENGWLHCTAESDLIFGTDNHGKYEKALKKLGIDLGMLSSEAGHAWQGSGIRNQETVELIS